MIIRNHTEYESGHEHGPDCGCCTDSHFNQMCEEDPEYDGEEEEAEEEAEAEEAAPGEVAPKADFGANGDEFHS